MVIDISLQVWLPMNNGDATQQGISNSSIVSCTATSNTSGKIGKCLSFNGTDSYILGTHDCFTNASATEWSYACCIKVNNSHNGCIWSCRNSTNNNGMTIFYYSGSWIFDDGSRWQFTPKTTINSGTWYHVCFTRSASTGKRCYYLNGVLDSTTSTSTAPTNVCTTHFAIGNSQSSAQGLTGNPFNGYLNDVRVYDHCLSPKEVELLSRGLIVHYPFNDPYVENTSNLCNVQYISAGTSGGWGGHSGVVSVVDSSDFNIPCVQCNKLIISYSGSGGGGFGRGVQNITVSPSTVYTCSFYFKTSENFTSQNLGNLIYIREYNSSGTQIREAGIWSSGNKEYVGDGWYRLWGTFTTQSSTVKIQPCVYVYPNSNQEYYFGCWQVEQKDHMTPYILGSRSERITYDTSGYFHDGTNTSSLTTNSNSSRYGICTYFENDTNVITVPITIGDGSAITLSCWVRSKNGTQGKGNYQMPLNVSGGQYEFSIPNSGKFRQGFYINGSRYVNDYGSVNLLDKNWHMISATYDGTNIKRYVDGVLVNTTSVSGTLTTGNLTVCIGKYYGSTVYGSIELYESDVRIYATALTQEQITELYNTSASISNNGALMGYEFVEQ